MVECGDLLLTEVASQPFVAGLNLWVVESGLSWDDRLSSGVHDHRAVPVVGPHRSQQHPLLTDARAAESGIVLVLLRSILLSISTFES